MNKIMSFLKPVIFAVILSMSLSPALAVSRNQGVKAQQATSGATRSCLANETAIKTRMTQLTRLVRNMETTFDRIALRVQNYYTNTVLPSGKVVANYDSLVSDITTMKNTTQTALNKTQSSINSFSCTSNDPKILMNQFRLNMQSVKIALKNYRTSINKLIVAVNKTAESEVD